MSDPNPSALSFEPIVLPQRPLLQPEESLVRAEAFRAEMAWRRTVRDYSNRPVPREVIETCLKAASNAPSGANQQPWHFSVVGDPEIKRQIREAAEVEEKAFYEGRGGKEWLRTLAPLGTDWEKPFLEMAPWLIVVFAERTGRDGEGKPQKNYYVSESVGIATGFLIAALHHAGLATLTHTPNPMKFLSRICGRPANEKPYLILVAGYPAEDAMIPKAATVKKPLSEIASFL